MPRRSEPPTPPPEGIRRTSSPRSTQSLAIDTTTANYSRPRPAVGSLPPTPQSSRHDKLSFRLRSNSGLSLHTNEDALRRYTDYNADGSPRTPTFEAAGWGSIDGVATGPRPVTARQLSMERADSNLPIPDFFSPATFQMVLANPPTRDRFLRFARRQGVASDVEFLLGVANYQRSVTQFVDQLASVPRPIDLPFALSRSLNVDLKHLSSSVLPGLSNVFSESGTFVEQRVRNESYPSFVARQLALRAGAALSEDTNSRSADFRGLGTSFFLADAQHADLPILSVSDGFLSLIGYSREETLLRSAFFLEGSKTDLTTSSRIGEAVQQGAEAAEAILHYRRDSWPFWDMVSLMPLTDEDGVVRKYLGGYVNVSDTLANQDDILRVLSYGPIGVDMSDEEEEDPRASRRKSTRDCAPDRMPSARQRSGSTKGFFKQFKKSSGSPVSHSASTSVSTLSASSAFFDSRSSGSSLSHYARFLLLRPIPSSPTTPTPDKGRNSRAPSLRVVHASPAALDLLDVPLSPHACQGIDVFSLLANEAASPSVSKSFKSTVLQKVVQDKKPEKLNIFIGRGQHRRQGSVSGPLTSRSTIDVRDSRGEKSRERRASRPVSRSGFGSFVNSESSRADMVTSHWTPLKDVNGAVEYIVVVLSPAA